MLKNKDSKENREQRFKRVAGRRTQAVLNTLRILGNCSNKSAYSYSEEDISRIFRAVEEELRTTKARFRASKPKKFSL